MALPSSGGVVHCSFVYTCTVCGQYLSSHHDLGLLSWTQTELIKLPLIHSSYHPLIQQTHGHCNACRTWKCPCSFFILHHNRLQNAKIIQKLLSAVLDLWGVHMDLGHMRQNERIRYLMRWMGRRINIQTPIQTNSICPHQQSPILRPPDGWVAG